MSTDYGTYRLTFDPASDQITPSVEMTLSGEANVDQMLYLFEAFLQASGYVLKGNLEIVSNKEDKELFVPFTAYDFGDSDFLSLGNPVYGGCSNDAIVFG